MQFPIVEHPPPQETAAFFISTESVGKHRKGNSFFNVCRKDVTGRFCPVSELPGDDPMKGRLVEKLRSAKRGASLRTLLIYPFVILIVVTVILTGFLSLYNSGKAAEYMAWQLMDEIAARIEDRVLRFLERAHLVNEINANVFESGQIDLNSMRELQLHFWHQVRSFDYISYSYIGREDGGFIGARRRADGTLQIIATETLTGGQIRYWNTDDRGLTTTIFSSLPYYDHKTRPWYESGIEAKKPTWSPVFVDAGGEGLTITAATPLYDDVGKTQGVLGSSFIFSHINQFLRSLKIGESGLTFIIERSGMLVATSTLDATYTADKKRIASLESENPRISQTGKFISEQFGDLGKIDWKQRLSIHVQGERYFVQFSPVADQRGINWLIVVMIPENDFMSHIKAGNFNTVLLSLFALCSTIVLGFTIARRITRPILELNTAARSLAGGDWSQELKIDRRDEVGELTGSFNLMVKHLQSTTVSRDRLAEEIEERKKIESELQKLAAVVEHSSELVNLATLDGKMIFLNEAGGKMLGIPPHDVKNHSIMEVIPDGLKSKVEDEVFPTALREGRWEGELQYCSLLTGTLIDVHAMVFTIRGSDGEPLYLADVSLDITDRKHAEDELKDSEQLLQSTIHGYPIPAFMIGKDHRVIHWNRALEEFTGLQASAVIGTSEHWRAFYREERPCMADLLVNEDREAVLRWYGERAGKSEVLDEAYEATQLFPDLGETGKWLRFTAAAVRNSKGIIVGAIETLEDVTDREKAEEILKESENRYRAIFENTGTGTFIVEEDTTISLANAEFEKLTGYTRDEIENKMSWTAFVVKEDLERMLEQHRLRRADANAALKQYEFRLIDRLGRTRDCLVTIDMIADTKRSIASILDITERKLAEDALISKNRELNDIIEFLPDATVVIDRDRKVIAWNRAMEDMAGIGKEDVIGKPDRVCTIPFYGESRPFLLDLIDANEKDIESQYSYIERKGAITYAETFVPCVYGGRGAFVFAAAAPLFDIHGNRVGAIESIRDITESKKKEEALQESQQQLADIINFLPDATLVIDTRGNVIAWNRAMEEMTGILAADMVGKGDFEYALPFYGERRPILIDLVLKPQEEVEAEYRYVERKGTVIAGEAYMPVLRGGEAYLFGKASALFDSKGNIVGAIESIRDISERRRAEEALVQAEEKYRGIFENAMEGIYQTTADGRFIDVNPAFAHILGYDTPEDVLNTITDISRQIYVNREHRAQLLRLLIEQDKVPRFEAQFYRKDGSVASVTLNVRAVRDKSGQIAYLEGSAEDISDRKALEARLVQVQKMEAIGTLAGGIAHDFNNILAPIIGYSELALQEIPADTLLHGKIEQVLLSGFRAKDLVRQILTFSRKTEQERGPVQVGILIKETEQMLRSTLPSTIEIRRNISQNATYGTVMADPVQIHQVLMNLCTNAAHAMREKGGVLSIALAKVDIGSNFRPDIPGLEDGPYLRLSVADTGHGMDEEVLQRIFDPYFTTKGPDEGTGLGLAVVYGIVKDLSGGITVLSNPGEGTTFQVFFPMSAPGDSISTAVSGRLPTGEGRILIVDDEKHVVEMLKEMLEQLGYEVTLRYSSVDALGAFQAQPHHFDLVITDQTMPQMTGMNLAKEILKIRPDIPIILCTGFSAMVDEEVAGKIGIKVLLMKPVALRKMAEEIHKLLTRE
jgi:PAS domain S-box-containing protein